MTLTLHKYWLCNYVDNTATNDWPENLKSLWKCDWASFLSNSLVERILQSKFTGIDFSEETTESLLQVGISCLQAFVQENFVGPPLKDDEAFQNLSYHKITIDSECARGSLSIDGEELNCNVRNPELLAIAKLIFTHLKPEESSLDSFVQRSWYLRFSLIHQLVVDEHADTLFTSILNVGSDILTDIETLPLDVETKTIACLEVLQGLIHYRRIWKAEGVLAKAKSILGATIQIEGKLGVRTKYQQKALPQLLLTVDVEDLQQGLDPSAQSHQSSESNRLPALLQLDDDVRLEKIRFLDETDNNILNLSSVVQALVLGTFQFIQKSQPKDKLADEELLPYLVTLLYQEHGPWPIRVTALLANVLFESTHKRTVERSLRQSELLLKLVTSSDDHTNFHRLSYVYASYIRPHWFIRATLGDLMVSLGLIKSALDLYLQIQKWESVISCYTLLELKHRAAEVIRSELEKKQTVELYCQLGDATDDVTWYEKAWELSGQRSGRAQRHLGCYYFTKKQYEEAIPYLEKSLSINSLQENVWARLGYAAIALERWELAAHAYRQYTNIEPNGFECWNNLAKAYINLGDKRRAHKIFSEALRCNFDNWKVWENFLVVSVDTGNFEDALNSHQRLIELKDKYLDKEILGIVVKAIRENIPDAEGRPSSRLAKKALSLLAHLCVQYPSEGVLFEHAAHLSINDPLSRAQKLQRAYRSYTQGQSAAWSKHPELAAKVLNVAKELCEASIESVATQTDSNKTLVLSQLSSARLSTQGCIKAARDEKWDHCEDVLNQLDVLLDNIKNILTKKL